MAKAAPHVVFKGTVQRKGPAGFIELPFDPKAAFGKVRAPVCRAASGSTCASTSTPTSGP
jgi:hypothetical protein